MEQKQIIIYVFSQGADYGFEKGFTSATKYLRATIGVMPDEKTKIRVENLITGLEKISDKVHTDFVQRLNITIVKMDTPESGIPQ